MGTNKILKALKDEIDWSKHSTLNVTEEYKRGFIKGLEQAMDIIKQLEC